MAYLAAGCRGDGEPTPGAREYVSALFSTPPGQESYGDELLQTCDVPCGLHVQYVSFPRTWRCRNRHAWYVLHTGTVPVLYLPDTSRMIRQALPRPSIADHALSKIQSAVQYKYRTEYNMLFPVPYCTVLLAPNNRTKCRGPMRRHDYPISLFYLRNEAGKL